MSATNFSPGSDEAALRANYEAARHALQSGDADEAELICRRALPVHGRDPNLLCLLGEICLRLRRPQEAGNLFTEVLGRHADFPRALEGMGLSLLAGKAAADACEFLSRAAALLPRRARTRVALARALAEAGRPEEADRAMQEAFRLNPRQAALNRAENALADGRLDEGEKILRELLARDPDDIKALRMLGNLAGEAGRFGAARKMLERAVELQPGFVRGWNDLANLFMKQDLYDEALAAVQRAIGIDPSMVHSWVTRGNILSRAQRHQESLEAYRHALQLSPRSAGALAGLGHVLKTVGQQQESVQAYRECVRAHPGFGEAWWSLANLKTFEFDADEVRLMEDMAERPGLPDEPRVNLLMALGKHYDNERDYDRAFGYYRRGNELRRQHEVYDPVQTQVVHDRIIDVFSREFLEARAGWGDPDPAPILIVGLPRSGSTLLEQILASHSQVEGTMELPDLARIIGELSRRTPGRAEYPEAAREMSSEMAAELGQAYIRSTRRYRSGRPFFIDKMPNNFANLGFLHLVLPNAKVIDARRHPLDSCLGSYRQLFYKGQSFTYDPFELGHYYLEYRRIMDHWHAVLPGKVLDLRYEDLVEDQEGQTRRLLEFLGLPWEEGCLRFYETERAINTASSEQVRQPIYRGAVNYWRNYERHLGELIETLQPLLRDLHPEDRPQNM